MFEYMIPRHVSSLLLISALFILSGCEREHGDIEYTNPFDIDNPETGGDPYNLRVEDTEAGVLVQWDEIPNIQGVDIYRSSSWYYYSAYYGYEKIGTSSSEEYLDTEVQPNTTYYYYIQAYSAGMKASISQIVEITISPDEADYGNQWGVIPALESSASSGYGSYVAP